MSYTIENVKGFNSYAKNDLEPGQYTFRVSFVKPKVGDQPFNQGKTIYSLACNPLKDNSNADSYDKSRTLWCDITMPEVPASDASAEVVEDFKKGLKSVAYWAQCLGLVDASPAKQAGPEAYEAWALTAVNAIADNPDSMLEKFFNGVVMINPKGYPKLAKKTPLASF